MPLTATLLTRPQLPGPAILDLLSHLSEQPGDIALLHSAQGNGPSVLACEPVLTIEIDHTAKARWIMHRDLSLPAENFPRDPLAAWQQMLNSITLISTDSASQPLPLGWLGGISYDIGRHLETINPSAKDDSHWPLMRWTLFDAYFVFDPLTNHWTLATFDWNQPRKESSTHRLDRFQNLLVSVKPAGEIPSSPGRIQMALSPQSYCAEVERVKNYISAGDIYQANLAQRWTVQTSDQPVQIYRRLCQKSPAEYAAFFRFGSRSILSASPELFLNRRGNELTTRPIKGTRPRDLSNPIHDEALKNELLQSPKDQAELAMIVDLLRNDLGRVSRFGSVHVTESRKLELLPTLWHTVATLCGSLDSHQANAWSAIIRAMCPGGSITGVPKIRAMQIIEELEDVRRGWYCGNLGWIGLQDSGSLNIAIRTILMEDNIAHVWAGGGIVADSQPLEEFNETRAKARAMLEALGVVAG